MSSTNLGQQSKSMELNPIYRDKSSNVFNTIMNISKVYLGMAILTLPRAMSNTGIGLGIIGVVLSGGLNWYSIYLQAEARRKYMKIQQLEEALEQEAANQTTDSIPNSLFEFSQDSFEIVSIKEPK